MVVSSYVAEQRYNSLGLPEISFSRADDLDTGAFRIRSESRETVAPAIPAYVNPEITSQIPVDAFTQSVTPTLTTIDGHEFKLNKSVTNSGRGEEAGARRL